MADSDKRRQVWERGSSGGQTSKEPYLNAQMGARRPGRDAVLFRELPAALALEGGVNPENRGRKLHLRPETELRIRIRCLLCFRKCVTFYSDNDLLFGTSHSTNSVRINCHQVAGEKR